MSQEVSTVDKYGCFMRSRTWRGKGTTVSPEAIHARTLRAFGYASIIIHNCRITKTWKVFDDVNNEIVSSTT